MRFVLALIISLIPASAAALSTREATICAGNLLNAYNNRQYPARYLDVQRIIQSAYGPIYRSLRGNDRSQAWNVAEAILRESFTHNTGVYRYNSIVVSRVEDTRVGHRIRGTVHLTSPRYTGTISFLALTAGECAIYQARFESVYSLSGELRNELKRHPDTRHLWR